MEFTIKAAEKWASGGSEDQAAGNSSPGSPFSIFQRGRKRNRLLPIGTLGVCTDEKKERRGARENLLTISDNTT